MLWLYFLAEILDEKILAISHIRISQIWTKKSEMKYQKAYVVDDDFLAPEVKNKRKFHCILSWKSNLLDLWVLLIGFPLKSTQQWQIKG